MHRMETIGIETAQGVQLKVHQVDGDSEKHSIGTNGERLCSVRDENNMVIEGTYFHQRDIHKPTWTSPSGATKSQIDHVLINGKWRNSLQDLRAYRGADVASGSSLTEVAQGTKKTGTGAPVQFQ